MSDISRPVLGHSAPGGINLGNALTHSANKGDPLSTTARFQWNLTGGEIGGNSGSNLQLQAIADDGKTVIATPISIDRATGNATIQGSGGGGGGGLQVAKVTLSSAQILALNTTPIQIIAAPGAGNMVIPVAFSFNAGAGTTAYTFTGTAGLYYGDPANTNLVDQNSFFAAASDGPAILNRSNPGTINENPPDQFINQNLVAFADTSNPLLGDFPITVTVLYQVITP